MNDLIYNTSQTLYNTVRYNLFALFIVNIMAISSSFCVAKPAINAWEAPRVNSLETLSLKDAILHSFERSPVIAQAAAQVDLGKYQIDEAKSAWLPKINLNGSSSYSKITDKDSTNSASYSVGVSQLVYDFGVSEHAVNKQKSVSDYYYYNMLAEMNNLAEQVAVGYLNVKRYQALCEISKNSIDNLNVLYDITLLRSNAGISSNSDYLQAETKIASMNETLVQYQSMLQIAISELSILTGIKTDQLPDYPEQLTQLNIGIGQIDYQKIASVKAAHMLQKTAKYEIERANAQGLPTINLNARRAKYDGDSSSYWDNTVALDVSVPLYQGGSIRSQVKQAESSYAASSASLNEAKLEINRKIEVALANLNGSKFRITAGDKQHAIATRTRDIYKNEYKLNKRSLNDLLSIEQDIHQASVTRVNAEIDSWSSMVSYAAAIDQLLPTLDITKEDHQDELPDF